MAYMGGSLLYEMILPGGSSILFYSILFYPILFFLGKCHGSANKFSLNDDGVDMVGIKCSYREKSSGKVEFLLLMMPLLVPTVIMGTDGNAIISKYEQKNLNVISSRDGRNIKDSTGEDLRQKE